MEKPYEPWPQEREEWRKWCASKRPEIVKILQKAEHLISEGDDNAARQAVWDALQGILDFERWWQHFGPKQNVVFKD